MDMSLALPLHKDCGQTVCSLRHDAHPNPTLVGGWSSHDSIFHCFVDMNDEKLGKI